MVGSRVKCNLSLALGAHVRWFSSQMWCSTSTNSISKYWKWLSGSKKLTFWFRDLSLPILGMLLSPFMRRFRRMIVLILSPLFNRLLAIDSELLQIALWWFYTLSLLTVNGSKLLIKKTHFALDSIDFISAKMFIGAKIVSLQHHHQRRNVRVSFRGTIRSHLLHVSIVVDRRFAHEAIKCLNCFQMIVNGNYRHDNNIRIINSGTEVSDESSYLLASNVCYNSNGFKFSSLHLWLECNFSRRKKTFTNWQMSTPLQSPKKSRSLLYGIPLLRNCSKLLAHVNDNDMHKESTQRIKDKHCYVPMLLPVKASSDTVDSIYKFLVHHAYTLSGGNFIITYLSKFNRFLAFSFSNFISALHLYLFLSLLSHMLTRSYDQTADRYQPNIASPYLTVFDCTDYFSSVTMMTTNLNWLKYLGEQKYHNIISITTIIQFSILLLQDTLVVRYCSKVSLTNQFACISFSIMNFCILRQRMGVIIIMNQEFVWNDFKIQFSGNRTSIKNVVCLSCNFALIHFLIFPYD